MNQEIQPVLSGTTGTEVELGDKISFDKTLDIIGRIRKNSVPDDCCFKYVYTHLDYVAQANQYAPAEKNEIGRLGIKLNFLQNARMHCRENCNSTNSTAREMLDTCAKNIQAGRCRDKFMQHIIGEVLYPDFYQKQK